METPIFRHQVNGVARDSTPWAFADFSYCPKRHGFLAGYPQELSSYALHRGAPSVIDCMVPAALNLYVA